jgi:hypothetical protein
MLEAKQNYRSVLLIGNDITEWLSYEEAIKPHAAKKCRGKKCYRHVSGSSLIKYRTFFFWIL